MAVRQTLSVTDEMIDRIQTTFSQHIKELVKNAQPPSKRRHLVCTAPLTLEAEHAEIPLFSKAYEDSMLRPPKDNESPCSHGSRCECTLMADIDPSIDSSLGFIGVAAHKGLCILCLRCRTTQLFYEYLITNTIPTNVIQTHRNDIETVGEYHKNCVHLPDQFRGIISPVVMHQRCNYSYRDGMIIQRNVDFHQAL